MNHLLVVLLLFISCLSWAGNDPAHPLTYKDWKRVQIHESRMKVVQISAEIKDMKLQSMPVEMAGDMSDVSHQNNLRKRESELETALHNLQSSKQLLFEDYFDVYLVKFVKNERALKHIAKRFSRESVFQLLKRSLNKGQGSEKILVLDSERPSPKNQ